jgi:hypothetical protein
MTTNKYGAQAKSPPTPGWEIDYNSSFAGIVKIKFTDKAMKLKLEKLGLTVIAHAPQWNSLVYNEMNKKYMNMSNEKWKSKFTNNISRHRGPKRGVVKLDYTKKTERIEGLTASKIVLKEKTASGAMDISTELWVAKELSSPPQFKEFLSQVLRVPSNFQGTPLRIAVNQKNANQNTGHMVQALDAYRVIRLNTTDLDFKPLTGYGLVSNEISLMMDDDEAQSLVGTP